MTLASSDRKRSRVVNLGGPVSANNGQSGSKIHRLKTDVPGEAPDCLGYIGGYRQFNANLNRSTSTGRVKSDLPPPKFWVGAVAFSLMRILHSTHFANARAQSVVRFVKWFRNLTVPCELLPPLEVLVETRVIE